MDQELVTLVTIQQIIMVVLVGIQYHHQAVVQVIHIAQDQLKMVQHMIYQVVLVRELMDTVEVVEQVVILT